MGVEGVKKSLADYLLLPSHESSSSVSLYRMTIFRLSAAAVKAFMECYRRHLAILLGYLPFLYVTISHFHVHGSFCRIQTGLEVKWCKHGLSGVQ